MVVQSNVGIKLSGFFRGQVLKHLDFGKCKIWIPGVYPQEYKKSPDLLPDAEQASPFFCGGTDGNGVYSYPKKDAIVWCFFQNEDQNLPVYFASTLGSGGGSRCFEETHNQEMKDGEPEPYAHFISAGKTSIKISEGGQVWITTNGNNGKTTLKMNPDGTIEIANDKMLKIRSENIKIIASNKFEVDAKNISLISTNQLNEFSKNVQIKSTEYTNVQSKRHPTGVSL